MVQRTDPKDQQTNYAYFQDWLLRQVSYAADDQRLSTAFSNAVIATPSVTFTYDASYGRLATMTEVLPPLAASDTGGSDQCRRRSGSLDRRSAARRSR